MKPAESESEIQQLIQVEAVKENCVLMRNNSGAFRDVGGRHVRYGLMNISKKQNEKIKSSDLIGVTEVLVTEEMVGKTLGVFTAVEVKPPGWTLVPKDQRGHAQLAFIEWVKKKGGIAGFATSVEEFKELVNEF